jgi:hypothetical protein
MSTFRSGQRPGRGTGFAAAAFALAAHSANAGAPRRSVMHAESTP